MFKLSEIEDVSRERLPTGLLDLDFMFGIERSGKDPIGLPGLVRGSITFLAAVGGTGRSRLAVQICSHMNRMNNKSIYFQMESGLSNFKLMVKGKIKRDDTFFVSTEKDYKKQIESILEVKPDFVVVDSVNMYDFHHNKAKGCIEDFRACAAKVNCAVLFIGQLDENSGDKKIVRGSQQWVYLPDVVCYACGVTSSYKDTHKRIKNSFQRYSLELDIPINSKHRASMDVMAKNEYESKKRINKSRFIISIPDKNKFGQTGKSVVLEHVDSGVRVYEND